MSRAVAPTILPQRELRNRIGQILKRAHDGEIFTITTNGDPVARLSPVEEAVWDSHRPSAKTESLNEMITKVGQPATDHIPVASANMFEGIEW